MQPQDTALIPLRARDGSVRAYAIVDAADADWVNQWRWCLTEGYASRHDVRDGHPTTTYLHRSLMGCTPGDGWEVDHIDRDRLNCSRSNLRRTTKRGNRQNVAGNPAGTSKHRGVYWDKTIGYWRARVYSGGRGYYFGAFKDEQRAAAAAHAGRMKLLECAVD